MTVCANAVDDSSRQRLFCRVRIFRIGGRRVAVTGCHRPRRLRRHPRPQRRGHRLTDPVRAVLLAHHHEADTWVLLSHSGFANDLALTAECPFLDVIFAGHCHSDHYAPELVGDTLVVKGGKLGAGYALAEPVGVGWAAHTCSLPTDHATWPTHLAPVARQAAALREKLSAPLGLTAESYRHTMPDRHQLLADIAARLRCGLGVDAVILNDTTLGPHPAGMVLTFGDLLVIEPFANHITHAPVPDAHRYAPAGLLAYLTGRVERLVTAPDPLPVGLVSVLTTDCLAKNFLGVRTHPAGMSFSQAVRHALTGSPTSEGRHPR
ncbi:bifunctional metallophosphatase/5'-nucleotidase [Streptomyces klenkii]|uniref:bifunctional metallophosphatase/5'-nucleotidase n=1 Tax=Streptomyces klenkii TaxID=1420899 RepID=UPI003F4B1009